jgi:hypothetical protein
VRWRAVRDAKREVTEWVEGVEKELGIRGWSMAESVYQE